MISQTKIKDRLRNKTNPELVETIALAKKNKSWLTIANILASSTRKQSKVNLSRIDKETKAGDTIIIPGKVLSSGSISKKLRICALSISQSALEKLKETKSESVSIIEEIQKNPKAEGVKILR